MTTGDTREGFFDARVCGEMGHQGALVLEPPSTFLAFKQSLIRVYPSVSEEVSSLGERFTTALVCADKWTCPSVHVHVPLQVRFLLEEFTTRATHKVLVVPDEGRRRVFTSQMCHQSRMFRICHITVLALILILLPLLFRL